MYSCQVKLTFFPKIKFVELFYLFENCFLIAWELFCHSLVIIIPFFFSVYPGAIRQSVGHQSRGSHWWAHLTVPQVSFFFIVTSSTKLVVAFVAVHCGKFTLLNSHLTWNSVWLVPEIDVETCCRASKVLVVMNDRELWDSEILRLWNYWTQCWQSFVYLWGN